ncbi:putative histidine kinase-like protein HHK3p [Phaeosphaeria sp. MPI-PUGE-AT-0046c]|nr:putative histidine kinase-like protein HHK3p [Phaeosphaeria sp. MPI-PUGE-AT-0046c]
MPPKRDSFFPKADARVFQSKYQPPSPASRPTVVAPVLDIEHVDVPLRIWSTDAVESVYPSTDSQWAPAAIPLKANCPSYLAADRYLFPVLTQNERLRLTMLFYYTRGAIEDQELMSRLQEKVCLAKDTVGWEFVIAGLLDHNTYTRMVTVGLPLAILPRRESTCAHTVNQPPGMLFSLLNMSQDWRFDKSPHVAEGGLRAYVGVPLRFQTEFEQHVAFGSLCVASNSPQSELSVDQQRALARLADWIVSDIIISFKVRRQQEQRRMADLSVALQSLCDKGADMDQLVVESLQEIYPSASVVICKTSTGEIPLDGGTTFNTSELDNGLWEDCEYFEQLLEEQNHKDLIASRAVRAITIQCTDRNTPTFVVVSSRDFRLVFDDVDSSFVRICADILSRYWQGRALKEALDAKASFLRGITHQLRTPIHGILGSVELLTEDLKLLQTEPASNAWGIQGIPHLEQLNPQVYIDTIRTSAHELISTVNSLLRLNQWASIAEAERMSLAHSIVHIEAALLGDLAQLLPLDPANQPSLFFRRQFPRDCDSLNLDMQLFKDCIQPLITNAIQNTPGGVVAVVISLSDDFRSLIVDIEDNGHGLDIKDHERIFVAYEKADTHTTGPGLGLTLSCKTAMLQNGNVALVRSEIGQGSHFRAVFTDPICSSSLPKQISAKDELPRLPTTYHRLQSKSRTSPLGDHFERFLHGLGFTKSENLEGTFLVVDYTPDLGRLHMVTHSISRDQVGICLVPENAYGFLNFDSNRFVAQGNVLFVQGPFSSQILEESLNRADMMLASIGSIVPAREARAETVTGHVTEVKFEHGDITTTQSTAALQALDEGGLLLAVAVLKLDDRGGSSGVRLDPPGRKPMTLLVDDNAINLRLLEMYCKRRKIPYRTAEDGAQAVRLFEHHRMPVEDRLLGQPLVAQPFNLVLMDLQMPICDGIKALREIRAMEEKHGWKTSIISMLTGQDSPLDRANAAAAGANAFLVKPVGLKELDQCITQWFP